MDNVTNMNAVVNVDRIERLKPMSYTWEGDISVDEHLTKLISLFNQYELPVSVDFRKLVHWIPYGERASHMIHLYPAKLLPHIPAFFLNSKILSADRDIVLDPFCGSGTVVLEALLNNKRAIGADSNPLARLITNVKNTYIQRDILDSTLNKIITEYENTTQCHIKPDVVNLEYWFPAKNTDKLSMLKSSIYSITKKKTPIRNFFEIIFSNIVRRVSYSDPRIPVPVKMKTDKFKPGTEQYKRIGSVLSKIENTNIIELFKKHAYLNINRIQSIESFRNYEDSYLSICNDARHLITEEGEKVKDTTVQLIITSPPYSGAQKYIRSTSLNLGWIDLCKSKNLRGLQEKSIGREHYKKSEYSSYLSAGVDEADMHLSQIFTENPLRAHITSNYLLEMRIAMQEMYRVLKSSGYFILVSSANRICGKDFQTHKYLSIIAEQIGFKVKLVLVDDIHSRGLMTKRNKTAGVINSEWIYLFEKDAND